ncbi:MULTISPECIES: TRAP transporter permease [Marivita]|uniref:TRAP transporter fused permease subunit n=1 Tax=Marivita cryptomonadis TaxID=505252 RepID=A0A9Q2P2E5_9RHOB|nr:MULTISPECIES: TRAP transporter fused permease subunit [Marivita]MCR9169291.1 TRAP transporter fused permease subunit [Paracoccaceae bacterium]MBM2324020.1 TRAP transporter fused permease subunit [Marivita cryptomonadis]MBM2333610.1 TRAP transporter fused permease subunit [Marivita cryptomonadis]MBM2343187.1 TRAP transporter fused permease subunit [Marivita cryptomonadis]MBM2347859.1 TRAP transporter fused permease subunit [Marivita cryptomonadis]
MRILPTFAVGASVALVLFSLYTAAFGVLPDVMQRGIHLSLAIIIVYLHTASVAFENGNRWRVFALLSLAVLGVCGAGYQAVYYEAVVSRYGAMTDAEITIAAVAVIVLLDATRRTIGWSMVVLALVFLAYAFWGNLLWGDIAHRGYDLKRVLSQVFLGADGIFGTPLGVSATFVVLIVILGALLEGTGASGVLMDIAVAMTGRSRGGPAKAAVVGSSLMGMISGTAVSNVLTTGTISIPLMKRSGYKAHVAGAIEAVASTGGQLMPPIMGAAAFLMADIIETPYTDIARAAIIPAALFYLAVFSAVHLEAVKSGLKPMEPSEMPSAKKSLIEGGHVLLAIPAFVGFLMVGYSVMFSSLWAIYVLLFLSCLRRGTWLTPRKLLSVCKATGDAVLPVALATATAGIIIAVVTLTGIGLKFSSLIVTLSGGSLFLALVLTMLSSLILGMGLPTAAAYILVATLAAPALVNLGVDLLAAHMFVFYSAMLSAITPPVALAAFAAAAISGENPMRIAVVSVKFGIVAFVIPYFFVLDIRLLGVGDFSTLIIPVASAALGAMAVASAAQGWLAGALGWLLRVTLFAGAMMLIFPGTITNIAGLAALAGVYAFQKFAKPADPVKSPT